MAAVVILAAFDAAPILPLALIGVAVALVTRCVDADEGVAVMFAASASFATRIGCRADTLVHNAGGHRFADLPRIGLPMNLIVGARTVLAIPLFWPLSP
jgi:di/tricarboxylate transporter